LFLFVLLEDFGSYLSFFLLIGFFGIFEDVDEVFALGKVSIARTAE
jgi:hypothetical protein